MSSRILRRGALVAGVIMSLALPMGAATAAPAKPGLEPAVPASCSVGMTAVNAKGWRMWEVYDGATGAKRSQQQDPKMAFVPIALVNVGGMGDLTSFRSDDLVVASSGQVTQLIRMGTLSGTTWTITHSSTPVTSGWADTRALATGWLSIYRLTSTGLLRYPYSWSSTGISLGAPVSIPGNFSDVTTLSLSRSLGDPNTAAGVTTDILRITRTSGSLSEVTIPVSGTPSASVTVLRTAGFAGLSALSTGWCTDGVGEALLGIDSRGNAYAWYDANASDGSGADIVGGSRIVATGWKDKAYSQ